MRTIQAIKFPMRSMWDTTYTYCIDAAQVASIHYDCGQTVVTLKSGAAITMQLPEISHRQLVLMFRGHLAPEASDEINTELIALWREQHPDWPVGAGGEA